MKLGPAWTAGALAGIVPPAHSLPVETSVAGEGAGGPDFLRLLVQEVAP